VSALLAVAASSAEGLLVFVAFLPAAAFWGLDGYFLWQERLFRALYDHVRTIKEDSVDYGLSTQQFLPSSTWLQERQNSDPNEKGRRITWTRATFSRTLSVFHGAVLATITILAILGCTTSLFETSTQ
jgi:hypothetical protein